MDYPLAQSRDISYESYMAWDGRHRIEDYFIEIYNRGLHPTSWPASEVVAGYEEREKNRNFTKDYYKWIEENNLIVCEHGYPKDSGCSYCKWGTE